MIARAGLKPFEYNSANLVESLSFYGEHIRLSGITLVTAPVSYSAFNVAVLDAPVTNETELLFRVNAAANHFRALERGWNLYVCEDLLDARSLRKLDSLLDAMDLLRILDAPGMETSELGAPRHKIPELEYEEVTSARTRLAFAGLIGASFHIPYDVAKALYTPASRWQTALKGWVGFRKGEPVTCAATVQHAGALGVYSVATLPEHRRKGYAEAVMRSAVGVYRRGGFDGPIILQSTPDGRRLYRAMGFHRTTRFAVYATQF